MFDYKKASKAELKQEFARLKEITRDDGFFTTKEFFHLPQILQTNEQVLAIASGLLDGTTWLIALTNHRVIFLDKGFISGLKQLSIDLDKITSVGCKTGLLFGKIIIATNSAEYTITQIYKTTVLLFTNLINQAAEDSKKVAGHGIPEKKENDVIGQLERLAELKNKGILTDEEFTVQKMKLLS